MRFQDLENQKKAKEHLSEWSVGALFMKMGTGKTKVAIDLILKSNDVDLVLWVCPLRTIENVKKEFIKWGYKGSVQFVGVESLGMSDRIYLETLKKVQVNRNVFMVVDESIKIKNLDAKRTKRTINIGQYAKYKLILNGTPITKNLLDLKPQMDFLSPKILSMSDAEYKDTFCEYTTVTRRQGYKQYKKEWINGYHNIDYLYSLIKHYVFECDLELNVSKIYNELHYTISESEKKEYNRLKSKYLDNEMMLYKNNNIFLEMTQKMQHVYCIDEGKFKVLDLLKSKINFAETIIFCKFVKSLNECKKRYPQAKVLSYQTSAYGLNLQEYRHTIYFDKTWDYSTREQSIHRTYRHGQLNDCIYYDLTGDVGLESLIDKNIRKKQSIIDYLKQNSKTLKNEL